MIETAGGDRVKWQASHSGMRMLLLVNTRAARGERGLHAARRVFAHQNESGVRIVSTRTVEDIPRVLAAAQLQPHDVLAIQGGDGTVSSVLSELARLLPFARWPQLALLPGGTTNMNAFDVSGRVALRRALNALDARWQHARAVDHSQIECANGSAALAFGVRHRHVLCVEREAGQHPVWGFSFGAGAVVDGVRYSRDHVVRRGVGDELAAGVAALRAAWDIAKRDAAFVPNHPLRLGSGALQVETPMLALMLTTLDRLFLGSHPYWGSEPFAMHATWVEAPAPNFLRRLPWLLFSRNKARATARDPALGAYHSRNLPHAELHMHGQWTIDGELFGSADVRERLQVTPVGPLRCWVLR